MIEELIKSVVKRYVKTINFEAKVLSVDKTKDTCVIQAEDAPEIEGVKLRSILGDVATKLIVYPKVNSYVIVSLLYNMDAEVYVSQVSEVDEIITNCEQITYNGGENGGLVKVNELKTQLDKTNDVVNTIVNSLKNWITVPNDGGAALKTLFNANIGIKVVGDFSGIENEKIKH